MTILNDENLPQVMVERQEQPSVLKQRSKPYIERRVRRAEFSGPDDGWYVLDDTLKHQVKLASAKPRAEQFEDAVWCLLSRMGFRYLSRDRTCRIQYDAGAGAAQQVDVLAVDDECAVILECKCADGDTPKQATFKTDIEALQGKKPGLHREIRERFGKPHLKIAYVLATRNYILGPSDVDRLKALQIHHLSDIDFEYYQELVTHLGPAARFQFEADLFHGQDIRGIENRVYAVEASMGGVNYYSFTIEPERLLKLGYVLHRSKSIKILPTYQRLIKKGRLSSVRKFILNGGYFPNSLIVNIDSGGKSITFDPSTQSIDNSLSRAGVLHLPPRYRSVYIIDGQHRLYGYSGTGYGATNHVPVVAFVDLPREKQLRLFMEINENQKSVSPNLKHTLDADLKWDSKNLYERAEGVKKQLAQELGEDTASPLYRRILVGEDQRTEVKVITLEAILRGINLTKFVGRFTKDSVREQGYFNTGNSSSTVEKLRLLLSAYFRRIASDLPNEWERLPKDNGLLTINDGVTALIGIFGDIVDHMIKRDEIKPLSDGADKIVDVAATYFDSLSTFFDELSESDRVELRRKYGSGAPTRLRRIFQQAIHNERDDFSPPGMLEYWRDQSKLYNVETYSRVADIEMALRERVKEALQEAHGTMWLKKGMSEKLYTHLVTEAARKNRTIERDEDEKTPWDCLNLIHVREIFMHQAQWSTLFQKEFTIPGEDGRKKEEKTSWLVRLNTIRNNADHEYSVGKDDADYVGALHDWLILGDAEAIKRQGSAPAIDPLEEA